MKILLLSTGLSMGGAERQIVALADEYARRGHEVQLVGLTNEAQVLPSRADVVVKCLGMKKTLPGFFLAYCRLRRLIAGFRPDVVHSHMVHANVFARLIRLTVKIPRLICSAHSTNEGGALRMLAYRCTDRFADLTTNVSEEAVAAFIEKKAAPPERIVAIGNGIATDAFQFDAVVRAQTRASLGVGDEMPVILAVGRLSIPKDYSNLLHAFALVVMQVPESRLFIAGPGPLRDDMEELVQQLGLVGRAILLGYRSDVFRLYSAADVYALSSAWEGMPLVILEAMACERVVVATDCGGVKAVLGDTGLLVPPQDAEALASALLKALNWSSDDRQAMGHAARQRVLNNYSLAAIADRWLQLYSAPALAKQRTAS